MKSYFVYRNLHTNSFSVKYDGKVIEHPKVIILEDVQFKVSLKGQSRVRTNKRKNVHATVQAKERTCIWNGTFDQIELDKCEEIYYDPYFTDTFVIKSTNIPIHSADMILGQNNKLYLVKE